MNTCPPESGRNQEIFTTTCCFSLLYLLTSPSLLYKRNQHPNPGKMALWDTSLPSFQSAGFLNKVDILCPNEFSLHVLACCAASSRGLDSVTKSHPGNCLQNGKHLGMVCMLLPSSRGVYHYTIWEGQDKTKYLFYAGKVSFSALFQQAWQYTLGQI